MTLADRNVSREDLDARAVSERGAAALELIAAQSVLIRQQLVQIGAALSRLGALSASR